MGMCVIPLLAAINLLAPLPPNVQRALTFLPGTWEQRYKDDAEGSTEWRVEVWKVALFTERWIKNKWLGDGLGFSAAELATQIVRTTAERIGVQRPASQAHTALRDALMTPADQVPAATRRKLDLFTEPYWGSFEG